MKVYVAIGEVSPHLSPNPFVLTLTDGISNKHSDIHFFFGQSFFYEEECLQMDIVHIMWPHGLIFGNFLPVDLAKRLKEIKDRGVKIIATCHNIELHYCSEEKYLEAYKIVYQACDTIVHLGDYSKSLFERLYPPVRHVLIPHHVYDSIYTQLPSKAESALRLCLQSDKKYILCFGAFRNREEKQMIRVLGKKYRNSDVYILVPNYTSFLFDVKHPLKSVKSLLKKMYLRLFFHIICIGRYISNEEVPYYYGASDICLIQRLKILNSGNVPLAFFMGKVVVGPNQGNVYTILKKTGNPIFLTEDLTSIFTACSKGLELSKDGFGDLNRKYAIAELNTACISEKYYTVYQEVLKR